MNFLFKSVYDIDIDIDGGNNTDQRVISPQQLLLNLSWLTNLLMN